MTTSERLCMNAFLPLLVAVGWLAIATPAHAGDPCTRLRLQVDAPDVATRIAALACQENHAWFRTFIDADGRSLDNPFTKPRTCPWPMATRPGRK